MVGPAMMGTVAMPAVAAMEEAPNHNSSLTGCGRSREGHGDRGAIARGAIAL